MPQSAVFFQHPTDRNLNATGLNKGGIAPFDWPPGWYFIYEADSQPGGLYANPEPCGEFATEAEARAAWQENEYQADFALLIEDAAQHIAAEFNFPLVILGVTPDKPDGGLAYLQNPAVIDFPPDYPLT